MIEFKNLTERLYRAMAKNFLKRNNNQETRNKQ